MLNPDAKPKLDLSYAQVGREDQNTGLLDYPYVDGPPLKVTPSSLSFLTDCDSCQFYDYYSVKHPRGIFPPGKYQPWRNIPPREIFIRDIFLPEEYSLKFFWRCIFHATSLRPGK